MRPSDSAARISRKDVEDLNRASDKLALVANTIRQYKANWGPPLIEHLIDANNVIVRMMNKGGAAFAKYFEKHGGQDAAQATDAAELADEPGQDKPGADTKP